MDRISNMLWSAGAVLGRILAAATLFLIVSCIIEVWNRPVYPKHLPRVGYGPGLVASIKTFFKTPSQLKSWVDEGYRKVCLTLGLDRTERQATNKLMMVLIFWACSTTRITSLSLFLLVSVVGLRWSSLPHNSNGFLSNRTASSASTQPAMTRSTQSTTSSVMPTLRITSTIPLCIAIWPRLSAG